MPPNGSFIVCVCVRVCVWSQLRRNNYQNINLHLCVVFNFSFQNDFIADLCLLRQNRHKWSNGHFSECCVRLPCIIILLIFLSSFFLLSGLYLWKAHYFSLSNTDCKSVCLPTFWRKKYFWNTLREHWMIQTKPVSILSTLPTLIFERNFSIYWNSNCTFNCSMPIRSFTSFLVSFYLVCKRKHKIHRYSKKSIYIYTYAGHTHIWNSFSLKNRFVNNAHTYMQIQIELEQLVVEQKCYQYQKLIVHSQWVWM